MREQAREQAAVARLGPGETLEQRRQRLNTEADALGCDEREAAARAVDVALELVRDLAVSPRQDPRLREHSARLAAALGPYAEALNAKRPPD